MPTYWRFEPVETIKQLDALTHFTLGQDLKYYPNYSRWFNTKGRPEIEAGYKRAMIGLANGIVVADAIWQPEKTDSHLAELKQLRVALPFWNRRVATFLEAQVAEECSAAGFWGIICDTPSGRLDIARFFASRRYIPVATLSLYGTGTDTAWVKIFDKKRSGLIQQNASNIAFARAI